eukprot:3391943-Prymnesium_polylepis.1
MTERQFWRLHEQRRRRRDEEAVLHLPLRIRFKLPGNELLERGRIHPARAVGRRPHGDGVPRYARRQQRMDRLVERLLEREAEQRVCPLVEPAEAAEARALVGRKAPPREPRRDGARLDLDVDPDCARTRRAVLRRCRRAARNCGRQAMGVADRSEPTARQLRRAEGARQHGLERCVAVRSAPQQRVVTGVSGGAALQRAPQRHPPTRKQHTLVQLHLLHVVRLGRVKVGSFEKRFELSGLVVAERGHWMRKLRQPHRHAAAVRHRALESNRERRPSVQTKPALPECTWRVGHGRGAVVERRQHQERALHLLDARWPAVVPPHRCGWLEGDHGRGRRSPSSIVGKSQPRPPVSP